VTDFLDEKHREITDRLAELQPLVEEYQRLEAAVAALDGLGGSAAAPAAAPKAAVKAAVKAAPKAAAKKIPGRRGPGRPRGSKTKTKKAATAPATAAAAAPAATGRGGARRKAGRRKGSGTRAAQALSFVQEQAGITIPELAARMGIKQNYLYRVLPILEEEGKVVKQGRGWHPKA
jgi:ribosomal protein S25